MSKKISRRGVRCIAVAISAIMLFTCVPVLGASAQTDEVVNSENSAESSAAVTSQPIPQVKKVVKAGGADTSWYVGNEGASQYTLDEAVQLQGLAELVNSGTESFEGKTIKLLNEMVDVGIPPIGTKEHPFAGTFDGSDNTIEIILQIPSDQKSYIGLFGCITKDATIKNLDIKGTTIKVTENATTAGKQIRYVGAICGYAEGNIENCTSSIDIEITSQMILGTDPDNNPGIIRNIGGIVGYTDGNIAKCTNSGDIIISSESDINEEVAYLVGEIGGIAGAQGDVQDMETVPLIEDCTNTGNFKFDITGEGGKDRFGQQLYSICFAVGGLVGQTSGQVRRCTNTGDVNTSNGTTGAPEKGRGAANTGGIVGSLRGNSFEVACARSADPNFSNEDEAYRYYVQHGGNAGKPGSYPKTAGVYDCVNTGTVVGLAAVGGIVGNGGSFTEIEGCGNTGDVKGCRWSKPFAAGIVGNIQGNIRYCYNRGDVHSVTGGGYYCAGISGGIWTPHDSNAEDNKKAPIVEMVGCYTSGHIYTNSAGFRTGILAGENEGFIHDNIYVLGLSEDGKLVDLDTGTTSSNTGFSTENELKESKARGLLNIHAAGKGNWEICYLPTKSDDKNKGFPIPKRGELRIAESQPLPSGAEARLDEANGSTGEATYSAIGEPVPKIAVTADGKKLVQNADFRVIPEAGAKEVSIGMSEPRPYTATIEGIGIYSGQLSQTVKYGIGKANINECTIVADPAIYNWEVQQPKPEQVRLIDSAGNEVKKSDYTVSDKYVEGDDGKKGTDEDPDSEITDIHYYDYKNVHGRNYKYDVTVTAMAGGNYTGKSTQQAYRIRGASIMNQLPAGDPEYDPNKPESVIYGDVTWQGETWDFLTALRDKSGSTIQLPYTGKPITPTVKSITYKDRTLTEAKDYDYQQNPLDYDYRYIYGNPNSEETGGASTEPTNVTPAGEPSCMTVRYTNGGNFDNFINVFYQIVPADIGSASTTSPNVAYTGKAHNPRPVITWNKMQLVEGKDYTITGLSYASNVEVGMATIRFTLTGKGNFKGTYEKSATFSIVGKPKPVAVTSVRLSSTTAKIAVNKTKQLSATVLPTNAANKTVSWKSGNTKIATVTSKGLVKGIRPGTVNIVARSGGKSATCKITVVIPVSKISLTPTTVTINRNQTKKLTAKFTPSNASNKGLTWTSSNKNIAIVTYTGTVKGIRAGKVTITAKSNDGGKIAKRIVTVKSIPISKITLTPTTVTISRNKTKQLTAKITPSNASNKSLTWTSSNPRIAIVTHTGTVKGIRKGKVTITAKSKEGGKIAKRIVTVK